MQPESGALDVGKEFEPEPELGVLRPGLAWARDGDGVAANRACKATIVAERFAMKFPG